MAGRTRKTTEEKITALRDDIQESRENLNNYISNEKQRIKEMESELSNLEKTKRTEDAQRLLQIMDKQNIDVCELESLLTENRKKIG